MPLDVPPSRATSVYPFVLAVLIGLLFLSVLSRQRGGWSKQGESHPAVGRQFTALQLEPLLHTESALDIGDVAGKVVLINYWGPWCGPCRIEMPHLIALERAFAARVDFRIVSVSCGEYRDLAELRAETAAFARQSGLDFGVYHDPAAHSRLALVETADLDGFAYPTTVLLDGRQTIQGLWVGYAPGLEHEIRAAVAELLSQTQEI